MKGLIPLAWLMMWTAAVAEDFLYVLARPAGAASEIHWVPTDTPLGARVLVEDLSSARFIYRHRNALWWQERNELVERDLIGQTPGVNGGFEWQGTVRAMVGQGDQLYWSSRQIWTAGLQEEPRRLPGGATDFGSGLAVHEDRLYFSDRSRLHSARLDGTDVRIEDGGIDFPEPSAFGVSGIEVQGDLLLLGRERLLWQLHLKTREVKVLDPDLPEILDDIAVSNDAVYWVGGGKVWRWRGVPGEHERLYSLGDTQLNSLCVVSASPHPLTIDQRNRIYVEGRPGDVHQLLVSEDLQFWSPDFVERSLFTFQGSLGYLDPFTVMGDQPFVWQPKVSADEAYFRALRYQLEPPFDSDEDGLPDYWERRYFEDLSPGPADDTDGDGLSHLEEAAALSNPTVVDTDGDSLTDFEEVRLEIGSNPNVLDTDGDGLGDGVEVRTYGTKPTSRDSDSDSFDDAFEVAYASDPNDRESTPEPDAVLALYAEDLMVHFEFDSIDDGMIRNHGQLGGFGRLMGDGGFILDESEAKSSSGALELRASVKNASEGTYVVTDYGLVDLGIGQSGGEYTVAFWVRPSEQPLATVLGFAAQGRDASELPRFYLKNGGAYVSRCAIRFEGTDQQYRSDVGTGWHHVVWTVRENSWTLYVNGSPVSGNKTGKETANENGTLWLGALPGDHGPTEPFIGAIDDFRVYRTSLPAREVRLLSRRK